MSNGEETKHFDVSRVAAAIGCTSAKLQDALAQIGWEQLEREAERLAMVEPAPFSSNLVGQKKVPDVEQKWKCMLAATASLLNKQKPSNRRPSLGQRSGYLYVLYDGQTKLCKIGCTSGGGGERQHSIVAAHGSILVNVINAKVEDRFFAEAQCHRNFQAHRRSGEWFNADLVEVIEYIYAHVNWTEIDFENLARMAQYVIAFKLGNHVAARTALQR